MWRLTPGQSLRLRQYPDSDEAVLYNDLSGATHLLGGAAIHVLARLQDGPASATMLIDSLAEAAQCARSESFDADAHALLAQLAAYFLIDALP